MVWALVAVLGLPALAQAQLFPNASIKRKRVPCCQEPPVYKMYREQYYGHFPTCWRRWPSGWGCPTPEAPPPWDIVQREEPIRSQRDLDFPTLDTTVPGAGSPPSGALPLPDQGSPFEMPGAGAAPGFEPGLGAPPPPTTDGSLFDLPPQTQPPAPDGSGAGDLFPSLMPPGEGLDTSAELAPLPTAPEIPPMPGGLLPPGEGFGPSVEATPIPAPPAPRFDAPQHAPRRGLVAGMWDRLTTRLR